MKYFILIIALSAHAQFLYPQCTVGENDCDGDGTRYGQAAGLNNTANQVSLFGRSAGLDNTGEANSFFGFNAGRVNTSGNNNSFLVIVLGFLIMEA